MDKHIFIPIAVTALLLVAAFLLVYFGLEGGNNVLVVHFDAFRGIDFLGQKSDVYGIIGLGAVLSVINFMLSRVLHSRDKFLARLTAFASVSISALIFIAALVIVSNN